MREGLPLLGLYWLYSSIRWFVARESPYEAFDNAFKIIQLEQQLGVFHEPAIQGWLLNHALGIVYIANVFYTIGYFPVIIVCAALLYRFEPDRFQIYKQTFLLGLGFALFFFAVFPLAPPRMLPEYGFVDTQQVYSVGLYNHGLVSSFYNPYAAMPSLHFGWALLIGVIALTFDRRAFRIFGVLYPSFMALVIVTTGHHYFLDIAGGGIVVGLAYAVVKALPYLAKAPSSNAVGFNGYISFKKRPPQPRSRVRRHNPNVSIWSKDIHDLIQRRHLRSSITAFLANRRPPL